jgi:hypothetical protein
MTRRLGLVAALLALLLFLADGARAGLYWQLGVQTKLVSVCFVGDALTSRPFRVQQVLHYIREFEYAANVKFPVGGVTCAAPTRRPDGTEAYDGDIRVVLPHTSISGTGAVPGVGCPSFRDSMGNYTGGNEGWGSWSNAPNDLATNRSCLYNLKLGDDGAAGVPYLNHTLHEFGHALGLRHEHERTDVDRTLGCTESGFGGNGTAFLTRYDQRSVMHYKFSSCNINGNYDNAGLSDLDRLSVHILYPEDDQVAEYVGTTVVPSSSHVVLQSAWGIRGGDLAFVARSFEWRVGGIVRSTSSVMDVQLPVGDHSFQFSHGDFLGRSYSYVGTIRILTPAAFATQTAAVAAAQLPLLPALAP